MQANAKFIAAGGVKQSGSQRASSGSRLALLPPLVRAAASLYRQGGTSSLEPLHQRRHGAV
ncbi:hypothetical protein AAKU55_001355 [Oxalobacteraceae bacterium GrIS 1.11]